MAIASATDCKNTVVTREKGIKGEPGTNGTDGAGFASVRGTLLANPLVKALAPNYPAIVGFGFLSYERASTATGFNKYGQFAEAGSDTPRETIEGWYIEGGGTNLLLETDTLATQNITVTASPYVLSFFGTGTVTLSGAVSGSLVGTGDTDRVSLSFTPSAGTLTVTVSGTVDYAQIEQSAFMTSHIRSLDDAAPVVGVRAPDIVFMPAFNNTPLLTEDYSIWIGNVYFDGFTGGNDFILSFPNGVDTDTDTPCLFCNDGLLTYRFSDGTLSADATATILAETEYSICIRKESNQITLDVIGVSQDITPHSITPDTDTGGTLKIGGNEAGTDNNMFGKIYDLRVYDFLLNDDEVQFLSEV